VATTTTTTVVPTTTSTTSTTLEPTTTSTTSTSTSTSTTSTSSTSTSTTPLGGGPICVSGSPWDGTWPESGTHNAKFYWYTSASGGRYIFWDSGNSWWAVSTALDGTASDNDDGGEYPWSGTWGIITVTQGAC
jgi:hypothetical protein